MNRCVCCKEHHTSHTHTCIYNYVHIQMQPLKKKSKHFNMRMKPTAIKVFL